MKPNDTATSMGGLNFGSSSSITSVNNILAKRLDFWDSEVVFIVSSWGSGATLRLNFPSTIYAYQFELAPGGLLTVKSTENNVTYTGAPFLNGLGGNANLSNLKYFRIAHSASTGRVEFYAGISPDGSDQRIMTSDLGQGSKGTLTPTYTAIDSAEIQITSTNNTVLRAVNAPAGGLPRSVENKGAWYDRDFNNWYSYRTNQYNSAVAKANNEFYNEALFVTSGATVTNAGASRRALVLQGDGGNGGQTVIRTDFADGISDVNIKTSITPINAGAAESMFGIFWRNIAGTTSRYQLSIFGNSVRLEVWLAPFGVFSGIPAVSPTSILATAPLETLTGVSYEYTINHYGNKITVLRDGIQVIEATDTFNFISEQGQIGFQCATLVAASAAMSSYAIDKILVTSSYDEQSFATGVAFVNRTLGAYVSTLSRGVGGGSTSTLTPTLIDDFEAKTSSSMKIVYHFTSAAVVTTPSAPVDYSIINAARIHGFAGKTNVIVINNIVGNYNSSLNATLVNNLKEWATAINTIPGEVHVALLPFPDLNTPWSPYSYSHALKPTSSSPTSVIFDPAAGLSTNSLVGRTIRYKTAGSASLYTTVTANTNNSITASFVGNAVMVWAKDFGNRTDNPTNYILYYRELVNIMKPLCKAKFMFCMNYAPDFPSTDVRYSTSEVFSEIYPGDSWVDSFLIRAVNSGINNVKLGNNRGMEYWKSISDMLNGRSGEIAVLDPVSPYKAGEGIYPKIAAISGSRKIMVLTGCAETHSRFNDGYGGFSGSSINSTVGGQSGVNDIFSSTFGNIVYWEPANSGERNGAKRSIFNQAGFSSPSGGASDHFVRWTTPSPPLNRTSSLSFYFRLGAKVASSGVLLGAIVNSSNQVLVGIRVNDLGNIGILAPGSTFTSAGTDTGLTFVPNGWGKVELYWDASTAQYMVNFETFVTSPITDKYPAAKQIYSNVFTASASYIGSYAQDWYVGNMRTAQTNCWTTGAKFQDVRLSFDGTTSIYDKSEWLKDTFNTRKFPLVSGVILLAADMSLTPDVTPVTVTANQLTPMYQSLPFFDGRLDASKYTGDKLKNLFNIAVPERVNSAPQLRGSEFQSSAKVGQLEYMRLEEIGKAPLQLTPRLGGILLRDFDLGKAPSRSVQEDRPNADGVRDYTEFLGAKGVTLNFITFNDPSGSSSFYHDALISWSNPRRRPRLVYKFKNGEERYINLRPEPNSSSWSVDGIRSGTKEVSLGFAGIDGKDYSTSLKRVVVGPDIPATIVTDGTAATPCKIRIYGDSAGCQNPSIILLSKEQSSGSAVARISLGSANSPITIPIGQFIEIDIDRRTIQLNGVPGEGNSYLRYLTDRQWFYLESGTNLILFQSFNSTGYMSVTYRNAYL